MHIRQAIESDAAAIQRIHQASIREICARDYPKEIITAWHDGSSEARFIKRIREQSFWVGVEDVEDQEVVAFGSVFAENNKLESLFLAPQVLGRGWAGLLLNHLEEVAYDAGVKRLHLDASLSARNFYSKHGYIICEGEVAIELTLGGRFAGLPMAKDLCG